MIHTNTIFRVYTTQGGCFTHMLYMKYYRGCYINVFIYVCILECVMIYVCMFMNVSNL